MDRQNMQSIIEAFEIKPALQTYPTSRQPSKEAQNPFFFAQVQ